MRRLNSWTKEEAITHNLRDDGMAVAIFADSQPGRVWYCHQMIESVIKENQGRRLNIIELGCSAGDISGFFAEDHDCFGYDVVPEAVRLSKKRYPAFNVEVAAAEDVVPRECDVLVLCEFLEHVEDPINLVTSWLPLAKNVVIGHPLVCDGWDPEEGHLWAYCDEDFKNWFPLGGHELAASMEFSMGYRMALGYGRRI